MELSAGVCLTHPVIVVMSLRMRRESKKGLQLVLNPKNPVSLAAAKPEPKPEALAAAGPKA